VCVCVWVCVWVCVCVCVWVFGGGDASVWRRNASVKHEEKKHVQVKVAMKHFKMYLVYILMQA